MEIIAITSLCLVGLLFVALITLMIQSLYIVRQGEAILIERMGKYSKTLTSGPQFIVPFLERPREVVWTFVREVDRRRYQTIVRRMVRIDLRESVYEFPRQNVITKDNVTMEINALLYYQITEPKAAVYEVANLLEAIEKLAQTTLRNIIGSLDLDETLVSRDRINDKLRLILDDATDKWGVKVNRVELQEVTPPEDIRQAMEKQMRAERDRRAAILNAEGFKQAAILEAEGVLESQVLKARGQAEARLLNARSESESAILHAEGEAQARLKVALAESKAIEMVREAAQGDPLPYLTALKYIQALPEMTKGKNDKLVVIPYESSALMGSVASMKTIFENVK